MYGHSTPSRLPAWRTLLLGAVVCALVLAVSLAAMACGGSSTTENDGAFATVTDDNGAVVTIAAEPAQIVSTSPAATQILFALGVGDKVVGVNQWDDYPAEVADLPKVADMQVNIEAVMALSPDLVVGGAGQEDALATVQAGGAPVIVLNPPTIDAIYADITTVGQAVGADQAAEGLVKSMRDGLQELSEAAAATGETPSVFYALDDTLFTCGPGSFVDELITLASAVNVAAQSDGALDYFQFTPEQLVAADPDIVILGAFYGGVDKFTSDPRFTGLTAVTQGHVFALDAQYDNLLTLAAPRIVEGFAGLVQTIHPDVQVTE